MHDETLRKRWRQMHRRCTIPTDGKYPRYGARGIRVCPEWSDYAVFQAWAYANGYDPRLSLGRIDNDGDYQPSNCRWESPAQQSRNTSRNRLVTALGETRTLIEWAEDSRCQVPYQALHLRLTRRGWEPEQAILTPLVPRAESIRAISGNRRRYVSLKKRKPKSIRTDASRTYPLRVIRKPSSSRFRGVHWDHERRLWGATIQINKKTRSLGRHHLEVAAAKAYDEAARAAWGDRAILNFP